MRASLFFLLFLCSAASALAQDTFYVKKKSPALVQASPVVVYADTTLRDSIVSYTAEFQKPGTNIYARVHMKGPRLSIPPEAQGQRITFTEIIAVDRTGRKYRLPDRMYAGGYMVPVNTR
jgi:hypothetical protein